MFGLIGEIRMFSGDFAPRGWRLCDGSPMLIRDHSALFSLLGTRWGGDGRHTFALPDLRGRIPNGAGDGPGLSRRQVGDGKDFRASNGESVFLDARHLPPHRHEVALAGEGTSGGGGDAVARGSKARFGSKSESGMGIGAALGAGSGLPHPNLPPYQAVHFLICIDGRFPRRSG